MNLDVTRRTDSRRPISGPAVSSPRPHACPPARRAAPGRRRAGAIVEAALVLPILLALGFGTVEFGFFFWVKHNMQAAARQGARAAIVPSATNDEVTAAVLESLRAANLQNSGCTTAITDASGAPVDVADAAPGTSIKVTVQCHWGAAGVRPLGIISASKSVAGAAVMRKEG